MRKYTQKELKQLVAIGAAESLTGFNFDQMNEFIKTHDLEKVGYSSGINGINGGLVEDRKTGERYAITARNTALLMLF